MTSLLSRGGCSVQGSFQVPVNVPTKVVFIYLRLHTFKLLDQQELEQMMEVHPITQQYSGFERGLADHQPSVLTT